MPTSCISVYLNMGQKMLPDYRFICVISGFRREVDKNCALLGCYAASIGDSLPTFRDNILVPSSSVKNNSWLLKMGPTGYPETSVRNQHHSLRNSPEERSSHPFIYHLSCTTCWTGAPRRSCLIITETRRRKNQHVSEETQCNGRQLVNKRVV